MTTRAEARKHYQPRQPRESKPRTSPADYRPWTPADEARLRRMVPKGLDEGFMANKLGRPRGDVTAAIKRLGLEDKFYEPDPATAPLKDRLCLNCDRPFKSTADRICPACKSRVAFSSEVDPYQNNYKPKGIQ